MKIKTAFLLLALFCVLAQTGSAFALSKVPADVYAPFSQNRTEWTASVCQHMTAGGCAYFSAHEALPAWLILNDTDAVGTSVRFKEVVADFGGDLKLWRLELTITVSSGEEQTHEVFATVSAQNGNALLDRIILLDQTLLATE